MARTERRYDVDWVRVIGMTAVFVFHVMMYFNTWPWHAKNGVTSAAFEPVGLALLTWIMPLFFAVAGFAARQALTRRSAGEFVRERLLRLGVPLLVAIFLLSPLQVYSERVTYGKFSGNFLAFLPHYFEGWYSVTPDGNFAWMGLHLWFVLVLLVFSLVTLPFVRPDRASRRPGALGRLLQATGPWGMLLLTPCLLLLLEGLLHALGLDASQSGWPFGVYLAMYLVGYSLLASEFFRTALPRVGPVAAWGALPATLPAAFIPEPRQFGLSFITWHAVLACWLWIVGLLYIASRYLRRSSPALQYANEAVMPFYILHQPVIVGLGFAVRAVPLPLARKFPLLLAVDFAAIMALYHCVVRPVNPLRFLFGMKQRRCGATRLKNGRKDDQGADRPGLAYQ